MHEHVGKCAKRMHRSKESQMGGTKQARLAYQHCTKRRKVCIKHTNTTKVYLTNGFTQKSPRRDECNHTKQVALRTNKHNPTEVKNHGDA